MIGLLCFLLGIVQWYLYHIGNTYRFCIWTIYKFFMSSYCRYSLICGVKIGDIFDMLIFSHLSIISFWDTYLPIFSSCSSSILFAVLIIR
jgi:hypothetical protein